MCKTYIHSKIDMYSILHPTFVVCVYQRTADEIYVQFATRFTRTHTQAHMLARTIIQKRLSSCVFFLLLFSLSTYQSHIFACLFIFPMSILFSSHTSFQTNGIRFVFVGDKIDILLDILLRFSFTFLRIFFSKWIDVKTSGRELEIVFFLLRMKINFPYMCMSVYCGFYFDTKARKKCLHWNCTMKSAEKLNTPTTHECVCVVCERDGKMPFFAGGCGHLPSTLHICIYSIDTAALLINFHMNKLGEKSFRRPHFPNMCANENV